MITPMRLPGPSHRPSVPHLKPTWATKDVLFEIRRSMEIAKALGLSGIPGFVIGTDKCHLLP
jgi:hypothetical protein